MARQEAAEASQSDLSAKEHTKAAKAMERLQRRVTALEAELRDAQAAHHKLLARNEELAAALQTAKENEAIARRDAERAGGGGGGRGGGGGGGPLSGSNFAKMMGMQQEINQLKSHIETLTAGGARRR